MESKAKIKIKLSKMAAMDHTGRYPFLNSLQTLRGSPYLKAKALYWLAKVSQVVEPEIQAYAEASRAAFVRLGTKTQTGYTLNEEGLKKHKEEMEGVDRDIELPIDEKLKLPDEKLGADLMPLLDIVELE